MDTKELTKQAAEAVAADMVRRPPSGSDGIWRFDGVIRPILGKVAERTKEFWNEVEREARRQNAGKDAWDPGGYGVVASYAQTHAAFAVPGFAGARRNFMT